MVRLGKGCSGFVCHKSGNICFMMPSLYVVCRPTKQDQPRRARGLGKATAIHGVGCSAWLGRGPFRCHRGLAKPEARPAKEKPTAQETEAHVLNGSRWRVGAPLGEPGRAKTFPKPRHLSKGTTVGRPWVVIGSMGNRCDALPAPQRKSSADAWSVAESGRLERNVRPRLGYGRRKSEILSFPVDMVR